MINNFLYIFRLLPYDHE